MIDPAAQQSGTRHLFVVTGGPGAGKTSLIRELARQGFQHSPEAGRAIIRDQMRIGGTALPWGDRAAYARRMLQWDIESYRRAMTLCGPVIMDRGLPDIVGYLRLCRLPVPTDICRAIEAHPYNPRVFIAPHWPEIYATDNERKQDQIEARATYRMMRDTYEALGYQLIELPRTSISDRACFLRKHLAL